MTHDEIIKAERVFINGVWDTLKGDHNDLRKQQIILHLYRDAIREIAPAVLDEATNLADGHIPLGYMSERERSYCNEHGEEIAHAIRAMKTRYEQ